MSLNPAGQDLHGAIRRTSPGKFTQPKLKSLEMTGELNDSAIISASKKPIQAWKRDGIQGYAIPNVIDERKPLSVKKQRGFASEYRDQDTIARGSYGNVPQDMPSAYTQARFEPNCNPQYEGRYEIPQHPQQQPFHRTLPSPYAHFGRPRYDALGHHAAEVEARYLEWVRNGSGRGHPYHPNPLKSHPVTGFTPPKPQYDMDTYTQQEGGTEPFPSFWDQASAETPHRARYLTQNTSAPVTVDTINVQRSKTPTDAPLHPTYSNAIPIADFDGGDKSKKSKHAFNPRAAVYMSPTHSLLDDGRDSGHTTHRGHYAPQDQLSVHSTAIAFSYGSPSQVPMVRHNGAPLSGIVTRELSPFPILTLPPQETHNLSPATSHTLSGHEEAHHDKKMDQGTQTDKGKEVVTHCPKMNNGSADEKDTTAGLGDTETKDEKPLHPGDGKNEQGHKDSVPSYDELFPPLVSPSAGSGQSGNKGDVKTHTHSAPATSRSDINKTPNTTPHDKDISTSGKTATDAVSMKFTSDTQPDADKKPAGKKAGYWGKGKSSAKDKAATDQKDHPPTAGSSTANVMLKDTKPDTNVNEEQGTDRKEDGKGKKKTGAKNKGVVSSGPGFDKQLSNNQTHKNEVDSQEALTNPSTDSTGPVKSKGKKKKNRKASGVKTATSPQKYCSSSTTPSAKDEQFQLPQQQPSASDESKNKATGNGMREGDERKGG